MRRNCREQRWRWASKIQPSAATEQQWRPKSATAHPSIMFAPFYVWEHHDHAPEQMRACPSPTHRTRSEQAAGVSHFGSHSATRHGTATKERETRGGEGKMNHETRSQDMCNANAAPSARMKWRLGLEGAAGPHPHQRRGPPLDARPAACETVDGPPPTQECGPVGDGVS